MVTINLKGREIPLTFTTLEMQTIQEEIMSPLSKAINLTLGRNPEDSNDKSWFGSAEHLKAAAKMVRILGNAGLEESGEEPNLTDRFVMRALKPTALAGAISICMDAMTEGMASEIPEKKTQGPVDVVLEEIEKKKERDG